MESFLEKLKKGMNPEKNADTPSAGEVLPDEEDFSARPAADENNPAVATFAYAKTKPAKQDSDTDSRTRRGRPKKPALEVTPIPMMHTKESMNETEEDEDGADREETRTNPGTEKETEPQNGWLDPEGELVADVFQTDTELVIQSAIAGIKVQDLDVVIEEDMLTIKGNRENPLPNTGGDYFIKECYWGPFSRKIILPVEVDGSRTEALMKDGILIIRIPKIQREKKKKVSIKG